MRRLNDLFGVEPPHIAERLAVVAFDRLDRLRARARGLLEPNIAAYREILGDHPHLDQVIFPTATTVFPRLRRGSPDDIFERLRSEEETSLVPGRFFGRPDHIRVALGGQPPATREGLLRLRRALDAIP
jgi:aspartate/methionine/tyrosine aminotransferase